MTENGDTSTAQDRHKQNSIDGAFDPADPEKYALSFAVNGLVSA